jgi:hypothetical protein
MPIPSNHDDKKSIKTNKDVQNFFLHFSISACRKIQLLLGFFHWLKKATSP